MMHLLFTAITHMVKDHARATLSTPALYSLWASGWEQELVQWVHPKTNQSSDPKDDKQILCH